MAVQKSRAVRNGALFGKFARPVANREPPRKPGSTRQWNFVRKSRSLFVNDPNRKGGYRVRLCNYDSFVIVRHRLFWYIWQCSRK